MTILFIILCLVVSIITVLFIDSQIKLYCKNKIIKHNKELINKHIRQLTSLDDAKDKIIGYSGTERRDKYEEELSKELKIRHLVADLAMSLGLNTSCDYDGVESYEDIILYLKACIKEIRSLKQNIQE